MSTFGLPGIGGSLGTCAYCGEPFVAELLLGKKVRMVGIGGIDCAVHDNCFPKLQSIAQDGHIQFSDWTKLPDKSPLIPEMKRLDNEAREISSAPQS